VASCLSAAIGTLIMGLWANYPFALAPGMGLNAFFAFTVVLGMNVSWQAALTAVLIEGIIFILLTLTKFRETVVNEIPKNLKISISAGIGFFIAFIGFTGSKIIIQDPTTFLTLGNLRETTVLLSILGFTIMIVLQAYRVRGAILWGILAVTVLGMVLGIAEFPDRLFSMPPSLAPIAFKFDFSILTDPDFYIIMFTFLFTDFFDTVGTLVGVSSRADFLDEEGKLPRAREALMADAI